MTSKKFPKCEENGEEVEMDKFPLIIGDVEQGILVHKCPNCNNEIEESYSDYEPDGSHSSSKGEKAKDGERFCAERRKAESRLSPRNLAEAKSSRGEKGDGDKRC